METTGASTFGPRAVLASLGVALVVALIWAAAALASGGSSSTPQGASTPTGGGPSQGFVESSQGYGAAPSRDDCPGHGGSGGNTAPSGGSNGSSSPGNAL
jgi:hypothetical protein